MNLEKKLVIGIVIILGIIFVIVFFVIRPSILEIRDLSQKIENEQKTLEELYLKGQTITKAKKEFKEVEEKIPSLENVFLLEGEELEFITSLEKTARGNEINQEINLGIKQDFRDEYKIMSVNLFLRGNFSNLVKYFLEIEKLDFYFNIDSLNIIALENVKKEITASVVAKTYWRASE